MRDLILFSEIYNLIFLVYNAFIRHKQHSFCMIKGHLEIVCRTKFHMSVGKTKFYAMKLACACIIILLMLVSM